MSHFIQGIDHGGQIVFDAYEPDVLKPKMRKYVRTNTFENLLQRKGAHKIMEKICQRYSEQQQERHRYEQQLLITHKASELRRKLQSSMNPNVLGKSVEHFLDAQKVNLNKTHIDLKKIIPRIPKNFSLQKKYRSKINLKLNNIEEAQQIANGKDVYRKWVNDQNVRNNNPNLNKMTYIFQKILKKQRYRPIKTEPFSDKSQNNRDEQDLAISFMAGMHKRTQTEQISYLASKPNVKDKLVKLKTTNKFVNNQKSFCNIDESFYSIH